LYSLQRARARTRDADAPIPDKMRPQDIIAKKRDGGELSENEIGLFVNGICDGSWADYQVSAMAMAMVIRGLGEAEQDALTHAMLHSGEKLDFSGISAPKGDKHSTGGVGDKTSLIIAPIVAACGVAVPMISGRGLGHTGGTLDKLEAIPGYNVDLSTAEFHRIIDECGFAMAGQTADIVPADKKLYAIRDATATVPCIPMIVASIMSKKLAEGLDALILDVKTGSGAFMPQLDDSRALAEALVRTGRNFGVRTEAVISSMDQPLGQYVGNALEIYECITILRGEADEKAAATVDLSLELAARLLVLAGTPGDIERARAAAVDKLSSGEAFEKFRRNVELQGGDATVCDDPASLIDEGLEKVALTAASDGYLTALDTLGFGNAVCSIGGGRVKAEDSVDHAVGVECRARIGMKVEKGEVLGTLLCRRADDQVVKDLQACYRISSDPVEDVKPLVVEVVR
jgi:pyrimidine-nucleoside phosphorylase